MAQPRQHEYDRGWAGATLADSLDAESPILRPLLAGKFPALQQIVDSLSANNHRDREILLVAAVYLQLCDSMLNSDPETSDRAAIVFVCCELECLAAWLIKSRPQTIRGARILIRLADRIIEAREVDSGLAFAHGPAEKLLSLALGTLSENPFPTPVRPWHSETGR